MLKSSAGRTENSVPGDNSSVLCQLWHALQSWLFELQGLDVSPGEVRRVYRRSARIIWRYVRWPIGFWTSGMVLVCGSMVTGALPAGSLMIVSFLLTFFGIVWGGVVWRDWWNECFVVTDAELVVLYNSYAGKEPVLYVERGLLKQYQRSWWEMRGWVNRFLDVGTVYVQMGWSRAPLRVSEVSHPRAVEREIREACRAAVGAVRPRPVRGLGRRFRRI